MSKKKKKVKKAANDLAAKIERAVVKNPNGNPFKGMKFTEEERQALAEAGCV